MNTCSRGTRIGNVLGGALLEVGLANDDALERDGISDLAEAKVDDAALRLGVMTVDDALDLARGATRLDAALLSNVLEGSQLVVWVDITDTDAAREAVGDDEVNGLHAARLRVSWLGDDDTSGIIGPGEAVLGSVEVLLSAFGREEGDTRSGIARGVANRMDETAPDNPQDDRQHGVGDRNVVDDDRARLRWLAERRCWPSAIDMLDTILLDLKWWNLSSAC